MVSENKTWSMRLSSVPSSTETVLDIKPTGQRYTVSRRVKSFTLVVLSARMQKCPSESTAVSTRGGHVSERTAPNSTTDPTPSYP